MHARPSDPYKYPVGVPHDRPDPNGLPTSRQPSLPDQSGECACRRSHATWWSRVAGRRYLARSVCHLVSNPVATYPYCTNPVCYRECYCTVSACRPRGVLGAGWGHLQSTMPLDNYTCASSLPTETSGRAELGANTSNTEKAEDTGRIENRERRRPSQAKRPSCGPCREITHTMRKGDHRLRACNPPKNKRCKNCEVREMSPDDCLGTASRALWSAPRPLAPAPLVRHQATRSETCCHEQTRPRSSVSASNSWGTYDNGGHETTLSGEEYRAALPVEATSTASQSEGVGEADRTSAVANTESICSATRGAPLGTDSHSADSGVSKESIEDDLRGFTQPLASCSATCLRWSIPEGMTTAVDPFMGFEDQK